jgi:hypothetical protein
LFELTPIEKISIITQKIKSLLTNKYDVELSIKQQNAMSEPNQKQIEGLMLQEKNLAAQISVLVKEVEYLQNTNKAEADS